MAGLGMSTIRELGKAIAGKTETRHEQTKKAVVREIGSNGVYVEVAGSDVLAPVESSAATYRVGDVVQVTNRGGRLHIDGDVTAPSVGAVFVRQVVAPVAEAVKAAATVAAQGVKDSAAAQRIADEAQALASALNQHFWTDGSGIHVTEVTQEDWEDEPTGHNILINSLGVLLRNALLNSVSITDSATAFFDGLGNAASNVVARFGRDGAQVGKSDASHISTSSDGITFSDAEGVDAFTIKRYSGGYYPADWSDAVRVNRWNDGVTNYIGFTTIWNAAYDALPGRVMFNDYIAGYVVGTDSQFYIIRIRLGWIYTTVTGNNWPAGDYESCFQFFRDYRGSAGVGFCLRWDSALKKVMVTNSSVAGDDDIGTVGADVIALSNDNSSMNVDTALNVDGELSSSSDIRVANCLYTGNVYGTLQNLGFESGHIDTVTVEAGSIMSITRSLTFEYDQPPVVLVGFDSSSASANFGRCTVSAYNVTRTGFRIRVFNGDTATRAPALFYIVIPRM